MFCMFVDLGGIPGADGLIERGDAIEHGRHVRHEARVPEVGHVVAPRLRIARGEHIGHRGGFGSSTGFPQFRSSEQQFTSRVARPDTIPAAVLSLERSANGAASAPGMRVQHTTHNATSARDREIRIPRARSTPARGGAFQRRRENFGTARSRLSRVRNILEKRIWYEGKKLRVRQ